MLYVRQSRTAAIRSMPKGSPARCWPSIACSRTDSMLMGPGQCAKKLSRLFDDQRQAAEQLLALLESERESLRRGDAEPLEQFAADKSDLIGRLQALESEQRQLLGELAFSEDAADALDRALEWCDTDGRLRQLHAL